MAAGPVGGMSFPSLVEVIYRKLSDKKQIANGFRSGCGRRHAGLFVFFIGIKTVR